MVSPHSLDVMLYMLYMHIQCIILSLYHNMNGWVSGVKWNVAEQIIIQ